MNKVLKFALIVLGLNLIAFALLVIIAEQFVDSLEIGLTMLLVTPIVIILGELILGIVFAAGSAKKDLGKGMLIGCGVTVLIGLSVCGIFISM